MAEQYPALRAGQKVTGALLASMLSRTVRKVADTTNTTLTLADDPELQITVEANATYLFEGVLYTNNVTSDEDIQVAFTIPTGADGTWGGASRAVNTAGAQDGDSRFLGAALTTAKGYGTDDAGATQPTSLFINGLITTSSTAGTMVLQWAKVQNAAGATCTVYQDSWLKFTRIA